MEIKMGKLLDLTGQRFGLLVVVDIAPDYVSKSGHRLKQWLCLCDCGRTCTVTGCNLKSGRQLSCGCRRAETLKNIRFKHGMSGTKIHNLWMSMIQRCEDKRHKNFPRWGGRGIRVCHEWRSSFEEFYKDVSLLDHFGEEGYTLDRYPDKNGPYSPGNVRWATAKQQQDK